MNRRDAARIDWALNEDKRLLDLEFFSYKNRKIMDCVAENDVDCTGFIFKNIDGGDRLIADGVELEDIICRGILPDA